MEKCKFGLRDSRCRGRSEGRFAQAFDAHVVVFTALARKKEDALRVGADEVVVSTGGDVMEEHPGTFAFILDTVSGEHDFNAYQQLLRDWTVALFGSPAKPFAVASLLLIVGCRSISGSNVGGIAETQEILDFCAQRNITADIEIIPMQKVKRCRRARRPLCRSSST